MVLQQTYWLSSAVKQCSCNVAKGLSLRGICMGATPGILDMKRLSGILQKGQFEIVKTQRTGVINVFKVNFAKLVSI